MNTLQFVHPDSIQLSWLALLFIIFLYRVRIQGSALAMGEKLQSRLIRSISRSSRVLQLLFTLLFLMAGIFALMRPQTPGGIISLGQSQKAADIMVVLDVSKSMLAEDAAPNRLKRAKAEIAELLEKLSGHRIGLVGFAGRASVLCPLTTDYGFFHLTLRNAGPKSISKGGTNIGAALRKGLDAFGPGQAARLILLITDGEDHDSYPKEVATVAKEQGIHIITIGFGSESGSQITITDSQTGARTTLQDRDGVPVLSRLDGDLLREIALETDGAYVPAGTSALDLGSIVDRHIEPIITMGTEKTITVAPNEHYLPFVFIGLFSLVGIAWSGTRPRRIQG
jgi:Ca-activated chloride channel family protein